jgi:lysophospholipase L1-like esterase
VTGETTLGARTVAGRLLAFALLLVLLDAVAGWWLESLHATVGQGQLVGVVNSAIRARSDVLVLGASTALHHYDDRALTQRLGLRTFAAGVDGRGVGFSRGLLALAAAAHRPRLVVLDVSYAERDRTSAQLLSPYYGRNATVTGILGGDWRNRVKLASRAYRYNGLLLPILTNLGTPPMAWGFEPLDGALPPDAAPGGARRTDRGLGPWFDRELRRLVADARADGARIVFVESPTWGGRVGPLAMATYERVARELDVPFHHLTPERCPELAHATLYRDHAHLNRAGAELFTRRVADLLARELARPPAGAAR